MVELSRILTERGEEQVESCGLFVDTVKSFLAASPDGVVGSEAVVEVKCPLSCADTSMDWLASHDPSFCLQRDLVSGKLKAIVEGGEVMEYISALIIKLIKFEDV